MISCFQCSFQLSGAPILHWHTQVGNFIVHNPRAFLNPAASTEPYNSLFTAFEFKHALHRVSSNATRPDDVPHSFLGHNCSTITTSLLPLINITWSSHRLPTTWTQGYTISILKTYRAAIDPLSYRPIALLNSQCKLAEWMVYSRLLHVSEIYHWIPPRPSGFRRAHSTLDAIATLTQSPQTAFIKGYHTIAVFLDFDNAFASVWHAGLLLKLHLLGIRGNVPSWLHSFLSNRTYSVRTSRATSRHLTLSSGVRQESVLSSVLFSIFIRYIQEICHIGT